jgi:hypothetical protein
MAIPLWLTTLLDNSVFQIIGAIFTVVGLASLVYTTYNNIILVSNGLAPVLLRLARGLASRKIAVLATDRTNDLVALLTDSGLFKKKNIITVGFHDITRAEACSIKLVHWKPFERDVDRILKAKKDNDALIVYAPADEPRINDDSMKKLGLERNTIIVNFRGRLLNDLLTSMITTEFSKG